MKWSFIPLYWSKSCIFFPFNIKRSIPYGAETLTLLGYNTLAFFCSLAFFFFTTLHINQQSFYLSHLVKWHHIISSTFKYLPSSWDNGGLESSFSVPFKLICYNQPQKLGSLKSSGVVGWLSVWALEPECLGYISVSTTYKLCKLKQVT